MTVSQFTGIPFVAGSIFGERCWKVSKDGTLVSPSYSFGWETDNTSECRAMQTPPPVPYETVVEFIEKFVLRGKKVYKIERDYGHGTQQIPIELIIHWSETMGKRVPVMRDISLKTMSADDKMELETLVIRETGTHLLGWSSLYHLMRPWLNEVWEDDHDFASCSCGFYAYTNGANAYLRDNGVLGVVEGYGETLIGTRGFRSKKARIVALAPSPSPEREDATQIVTGKVTVTLSHTASPTPSSSVITSNDVNIRDASWTKPEKIIETSMNPFNAPSVLRSGSALPIYPVIDQPVEWDKVLAKYPEAVYFDDAEKMRAEYPCTDTSEWTNSEE